MRIGIVTFHRAYNCGAMLQAWALKRVLERMGHTVEFPYGKYNEVGRNPPRLSIYGRNRTGSYMRRVKSIAYRSLLTLLGKRDGITAGDYYDAFRKEYLPERKCEVAEFGKYFDVVILGSDQVLNPNIKGWTPYFLCNDIPSCVRKIAYSASAGEKPFDKSTLSSALESFEAVSVREPFMGFTVNLDPTLLLDSADYDTIAKPLRRRKEKEYVYMYSCEASSFEVKVARRIAERLGLDLLVTPTWGTYNRIKAIDFSNKISPSMMVSYIKGAKFVLAGSFHGTAIALVYGKPFLNVIPDHRSTKRVSAILECVGEADRIVNPDNGIEEMIARLTRPLGREYYDRLDKERQKSLNWLRKSIGEDGLTTATLNGELL